MSEIRIAENAEEVERCYAVMAQLRPQVAQAEFVELVRLQQAEGYRLAFLEVEGRVVTVAGFRVYHMLWSGKTLYIDDLSTDEAARSRGYGERMLEWLMAYAREMGCVTFSLDSGTWRTEAHAFYFRHGMRVKSFHFQMEL